MRGRTILGCVWTGVLLTAVTSGCSSGGESARGDGTVSGTGSGTTGSGVGGAADSSAASTDASTATTGPDSSATTATTGNGGSSSEVVTAAASTSVTPVVDGVGGTFTGNRNPDGGGNGDACQEFDIEFTPDIPTVYVLVDRSTSMWDNMFWDDLRDGTLAVIERLHEDVRFGLATFTGTGDSCPLDIEDAGVIDTNAYQAIADFYTPIMHPGVATETPTAAAVQWAQGVLEEDAVTFPGPKFMLLVTDGNPDWCDSGQVECRADTLVKALQDAYTAGIPSFIVALPDPGIDQNWLLAYANAGAGQPVGPMGDGGLADVQYCSEPTNGTEVFFPGTHPMAVYSDSMGTATPYQVDPANQDALVAELGGLVAGVKSCIFDLEGELEIDVDRADEGSVLVQTVSDPTGTSLSYDPTGTDGWTVTSDGVGVELVGSACELLRSPDTTGIEFNFPCDIIIPR